MQKTEIKFGTDGFRGIIGKDFTKDTIKRIIGAVSLYLKNLNTDKNTVIIGYDPRLNAKEDAQYSAELLKEYGFNVILSKKIVPTPIVAYNAKYYPDSIGAVMLTASHNPPEYQGIKFIPSYAGPASKDITDNILKYLDYTIDSSNKGTIEEKNLEDDYFSHIDKIIDFNTIKNNPPKIIYDGLYSCSIGYFDKILKNHSIDFEEYNMFHDCNFGQGLPEPKDKFLKHRKQGFITLANDGDADRYGVINENGNYVSPNIVLTLLAKYLFEKGLKGKIIKTVGVSNIVDMTAKKLSIETITTPVGFKWLSEEMRKNKTIIAGEDSGGLSIGGHIPEKDGILANLLIIEMLSSKNKTLFELEKDLIKEIGCEFFTDRIDIKFEKDEDISKLSEKFLNMKCISNFKIEKTLTLDGIKFIFDNEFSSLLIRKSGTEPLLRFYIESNNKEKLQKIKEFVQNNIKI